ncbi:hypothetical protein F5883DRAFT_633601 [Diaporthe sp. PMI_573]|nr:hypothetical protein F5883DRAFT_633601 [Diaporthaceae sp. PMI_573]
MTLSSQHPIINTGAAHEMPFAYMTDHRLAPPFSKNNAIRSSTSQDADLPPVFRHGNRLNDPRRDVGAFLHTDLRTPKLNRVHQYLWLAGLPRPARPLHRQRLLGRAVYLTEVPDEHLVWHETYILIKPLPEYLLSYSFWEDEICRDEALYQSACGLLLSYVWLISTRSDLRIAHEVGVLAPDIRWEPWTTLVLDFLRCVDIHTLHQVDRRYAYSELRLSRLNSLYRFGAAGFSLDKLVYGYMSGSTRYTTFFAHNFGWLLVIFIYITVVLSAMQVALATNKLGQDARFQGFSYGAALMSLAFVLVVVAVVLAVWLALFWFHLVSTIQYCNKTDLQRRPASV